MILWYFGTLPEFDVRGAVGPSRIFFNIDKGINEEIYSGKA